MTEPFDEYTDATDRPVRVGIALIRRGSFFLVRRRPEGAAMPGYWEFPGGKCEPGETFEAATIRESLEETGLDVRIVGLRETVSHRYSHALVEMQFFDAVLTDPGKSLSPGTGFVWCEGLELPNLTFPGANEPVVQSLLADLRKSEQS